MAKTKTGLAVLHSYDPKTGETSADPFEERSEDAGKTSPYHRAVALRDSIAGDFPGRIWSIGMDDRARELMAAENMRRWGLDGADADPAEEWVDA